MKPLHTQLLLKKSTSSPSKISGSPPLISSWSRSSLMLPQNIYDDSFMRNEKSHIKISFRLRIIAWGWQEWMWFSERQPPVKIVFLFLNEELFWILLRRIISDLPLCLDDWNSCIAIGASSTNCYELFYSGKLVLKMILKADRQGWFEFQVSYQPRKTNFHHHKS